MDKLIDISNLKISYYSLGKGEITILYLHGWKSHKELFLNVSSILKENYKIIAVDMPGFGNSQIPFEAYDNIKFAEFINKFIEKLDLNNIIIIGHSMGGRIFPLLNNNFNVIGFIGTGPAGLPQKRSLKMKISYLLNNSLLKSITPEKIKILLRSKDYKESSGYHRETIKNLLNRDMTEDIKKINKPTLLIWGKEDDQSPLWMAYKWKEYINNSELKIIEDCGHFPERDFSELTAKYIENFVIENFSNT